MIPVGILGSARVSSAAAAPTFISETHTSGVVGTHSYSSLSGLQTSDLMVLFTCGAFRTSSPPSGWTQLGDAGPGGLAITVSAFAKFATSSSESVLAPFGTNDASNFSIIAIYRGATKAWIRGLQTFGATQGSSALTFPDVTPGAAGPGQVGTFPLGTPTLSLMFLTNALAGAYTTSPTASATRLNVATTGSRYEYLYELPVNSTYTATPSGSIYRSGAVIHLA